MNSLFINYALGSCKINDVSDTFNWTFDDDVVVKISEATRVDKSTHKPFKMFWIEVNPNRRLVSFLEEIKSNGRARLYFRENGVRRFWNVCFDKAETRVPRILPKETLEESIQDLMLTEPIKARLAVLVKADEEAISLFKESQQKLLEQTAENVLGKIDSGEIVLKRFPQDDAETALKQFLQEEKIAAEKRLDAFMASQGESEFNRHLRLHARRMEGLIQC